MHQQLIDQCEKRLKTLLQSQAAIRRMRQTEDQREAEYTLEIGEQTAEICAIAQARVRPSDVPLVQARFGADCNQRMVFADYISATTADELRELGIWFTDRLGNAYIELPDKLLIWTTGAKPARMPAAKGQYFGAPGAKVLHYLVKHGPELQATYRDIRAAIGISIDKIGKVVRELTDMRILRSTGAGQIRITDANKLLDLWTAAYAAKLGPSLLHGAYVAANNPEPDELIRQAVEAMGEDVLVGAEVAADALTGYLRSDNLRLYVPEANWETVEKELQLAPSTRGKIELCTLYSEELRGAERIHGAIILDPAFVYVELIAGEHRRLTETAVRVREEYLAWTLSSD